MSVAITLAEAGLVPDQLTRRGIRSRLRKTLDRYDGGADDARELRQQELADILRDGPLAVHQDEANSQHYEVPAAFYQLMLGKHLKYSSCLYPSGGETLEQAEAAMLATTCERAQIQDGQHILELGCGWGSLSLWLAEHYPNAQITSVSNSHSQRAHIEGQASERGLSNLHIITADLATWEHDGSYDRVVSVECFEHLRNYAELFRRISTWLKPEGRLFYHVFAHRRSAYPFEVEGRDDWMARHFFTGGMMPSPELFEQFQDHLALDERWIEDGTHYAKTSAHWLENLDANRDQALSVLGDGVSRSEARRRFNRWRLFVMACEELFGYRGGREWVVLHHCMTRKDVA